MQEYPTRAARDLSYLIRSSRTGTNGFVDEVGRAVWYINPNLPLANVQTLQDVYDKSLTVTMFRQARPWCSSAIGVAIGLTVAFAIMQLMSSFLFEISPIDPLTYAVVSLTLMAATVLASHVPALRATAVDPIEALRAE